VANRNLPCFVFVVFGLCKVVCTIVNDYFLAFPDFFGRPHVCLTLNELVHKSGIRLCFAGASVREAHQAPVARGVNNSFGGRYCQPISVHIILTVLTVAFAILLLGEYVARVFADDIILLEISGGEEPLARVWYFALFDCKPQRFGAVGVARVHPNTDLVPATQTFRRGGCATNAFQLAGHFISCLGVG